MVLFVISMAVCVVICWGSWTIATNEMKCELAYIENEYPDFLEDALG